MISYVKGTVLEVTSETTTLETGGVGYELTCSLGCLGSLLPGKITALWAYTHVREDVIQLFGFERKEERSFFLSLLKVNGVGPKMAIKIMSAGTMERIMELIEAGDAKALSQLPKVGKKTSEQIILTLKGKLVNATDDAFRGSRSEILSGLVHLGFKASEAEKVVNEMSPEITLEDGIRQGLSALSAL